MRGFSASSRSSAARQASSAESSLTAHARARRAARPPARAAGRASGGRRAHHLLGGAERVQHGLLGRLHDGGEERIHARPRHEAQRCRTRRAAASSPRPMASSPWLAVENARKMSPEKCEPVVPVRARPSGTRRASALHWPGRSGASVATTAITEPAPGGASQAGSAIGSSSSRSRPTGTPATTSSPREPKLAWTKTPTVYSSEPCATRREARARAALEVVAVHAGAAADRALLDRPAARAVERRHDDLARDVAAVDVVEVAVPGLGRDRQRPHARELGVALGRPRDRRLLRDARPRACS